MVRIKTAPGTDTGGSTAGAPLHPRQENHLYLHDRTNARPQKKRGPEQNLFFSLKEDTGLSTFLKTGK